MALLATQNFGRAGVAMRTGAFVAAGGGDQFTNTGNELIAVFNGNAGVIVTVTIPTILLPDGFKAPDRNVQIPPGEAVLFGPFPIEWYGPTPPIDYSTPLNILVKVVRPTEMTKM